MKKSILFASCGRRCQLLKNCKESLGDSVRVVATDANATAPALYFADVSYVVPSIDDPSYIDVLLDICRTENVKAITTLIDPEIMLLSSNRERFEKEGILVLCPEPETARITFDKAWFCAYLKERGIPTVMTFDNLPEFIKAKEAGEISFPVFVKPRSGSGSVGARRVESQAELEILFEEEEGLIIQEFMNCAEADSDAYADPISGKLVACFAKRKLETRIGGASKTVSFFDVNLVEVMTRLVDLFDFKGPFDVDFFIKDGQYVVSEVNPRFGGAYLHAFGCGVDFFKLIAQNIEGHAASDRCFDYEDDRYMLMYDAAVIVSEKELANGFGV